MFDHHNLDALYLGRVCGGFTRESLIVIGQSAWSPVICCSSSARRATSAQSCPLVRSHAEPEYKPAYPLSHESSSPSSAWPRCIRRARPIPASIAACDYPGSSPSVALCATHTHAAKSEDLPLSSRNNAPAASTASSNRPMPGRQVVGQIAPLLAGTRYIPHCFEHRPEPVFALRRVFPAERQI